jgi:hypothetical protein
VQNLRVLQYVMKNYGDDQKMPFGTLTTAIITATVTSTTTTTSNTNA